MVIGKHFSESGVDVSQYRDGDVILVDDNNNHVRIRNGYQSLKKIVLRLGL